MAAIIADQYEIIVEDNMIIKAIKTDQMLFIYYIYAKNKNYEILEDERSDSGSGNELHQVSENSTQSVEKYKTFTYDYLLTLISQYCENNAQATQRVHQIASTWKLKSTENFLEKLLIHRYDKEVEDLNEFIEKLPQNLKAETAKYVHDEIWQNLKFFSELNQETS